MLNSVIHVLYFVLLILESVFIDPFREIPYFNKFNSYGNRVWLSWNDFWELARPIPPPDPNAFKGGVGARSRKSS